MLDIGLTKVSGPYTTTSLGPIWVLSRTDFSQKGTGWYLPMPKETNSLQHHRNHLHR